MKTKFIIIFALVLCISAFLLPTFAYAAANDVVQSDKTPPTIKAEINGDKLRIEVADADSGVEAIFIDEKRINYRVDGALVLSAKDFAGEEEKISIYAMDFAGNTSEVVTVVNPNYVNPTDTPASTEQPSAHSNPFTPNGQASVVDQASESDGKDFYSFTTAEGNIFYLVIDHQRGSDNVYFLNAVTEDDLQALAEKSDKKGSSAIPSTPTTKPADDNPEESEKPASSDTPPAKADGGNGTMIFIIIAIIVVGGAGYYLKVVKLKQQAFDSDEDDEDEDDEEMEFEDEPAESDDDVEDEAEDTD